MLAAAGIPVYDVPFVTVGGGMGSFIMADYLRIAGVPTNQMKVLSNLDAPWQTYEYLARCSQIPRPERLRSDSASRPDNLWGFPSYALSEKKLRQLWQILVEPVFDAFYTPKAGTVFSTIEKEYNRIRMSEMWAKGQVRMVRRRVGGGYFTILTPPPGASPTKRVAFRSQYVHICVGYPGLKYLPDLQAFREKSGDYSHVVNAYEPHEHVYEDMRTQPGTVVVRGGGVVATRVLQRLIDDRDKYNLQTRIVQIFRTYYAGAHGKNIWNRRPGGHGWAYQGFNYPKSVWGGQLKKKVRNLEGDERRKAYKEMGGTNTPWRPYWDKQQKRGRREGWYITMQGTVREVEKTDGDKLVSRVEGPQGATDVVSDYIVDCTGLEADIAEHRVLADLLEHGGAGRNPLGRLDVERSCEVRGTRSGQGAMYASGAATLGGYFPGVDTFLGLQITQQEICDDLAKHKFCKKIGPLRSTLQWLRWLFNKPVD